MKGGKLKNLKDIPIYIYTDGGSTNVGNVLVGAAAFRICKNWTTQTTGTLLEGATNNKAELEAISMALKELADSHPEDITNTPIYIMTDSEVAIKSIYRGAKELKKYYQKLDDANESLEDDDIYETLNELQLHTGDGKILKNQDVIKKILCRIFDMTRLSKTEVPIYKNIRFLHVYAHLNHKKMDDINKMIKKLKSQDYECDIEMAENIIKNNRMVDAVCTSLMGQTVPNAMKEEFPDLERVDDFFTSSSDFFKDGKIKEVSIF